MPPLSTSQTFTVSVVEVNVAPKLSFMREIRVTGASVSLDGNFSFTWSAQAGRPYQVQFKKSLSDAEWTNIEPPVSATGDSATFSALVSEAVERFYRVVSKP